MKSEQGFVYVCDRVFTLSSAPIPSDGENTRPPTALFLSHYLSVCGFFVMENMCWFFICVRVCMCVCVTAKCQFTVLITTSLTAQEWWVQGWRERLEAKKEGGGKPNDWWSWSYTTDCTWLWLVWVTSHTPYKHHRLFFVLYVTCNLSSKEHLATYHQAYLLAD